MKKNNPRQPTDSKSGLDSNQGLEFLNLGWIIAGTMALPLGSGFWLDKYLKTAPFFLLSGALLGLAGCGYSLYRLIKKLNASDNKERL